MNDLCIGELADIIDGRLQLGQMPPLGSGLEPVGEIVTDSRQVKSGDVFWGLAGPHHDGSQFAEEAFSRGAAGVVVAGRYAEPWAGRFSIQVENTKSALWQLARWIRDRFHGRVIAVTGSVGKTTARQMIHAVLGSRLSGSASPRNYNNHFGVPLSMLQLQQDHDYGVIELGASHIGEISSLAHLCRADVGVITRIGSAHLGSFGSEAAIAQSKAELLAALPPDGSAVLNGDDPRLRQVAGRCLAENMIWVGRGTSCDLVATDVCSRNGDLTFKIDQLPIHIPVWGRHHLTSALAAYAVGRLFQIPPEDIAAALASFQAPPMRCEVVEADGTTIINDTYNSSPSAMRAALELLRDFDASGRRIVVCGDMAELGDQAVVLHRQLGNDVVAVCGADMLVACGEHSRDVIQGARDAGMPLRRAIACSSPEMALPALTSSLAPGDVVLVKGCRAMEMERIVDALLGREAATAA